MSPGAPSSERAEPGPVVVPWRTLLCLLPVLVALLPFLGALGLPMTLRQDEGFLLVYPLRILEGDLPYRDFECVYGPGNALVLAGLFAGLGPSVLLERALGLAYRVLLVGSLFALARPWGRTAASTTAVLAACLLLVGPAPAAAFGWHGAAALLLAALVLLLRTGPGEGREPSGTGRMLAAGLLAGLALAFRPDVLPAVAFGMVASLSGREGLARGRGALGLGLLLGVVPLLVTVALASLPAAFENLVTTPVVRTRAGRAIPLEATGRDERLLLAACVGVAFLLVRPPGRSERPELVARRRCLGLVAFGLIPRALQRLDLVHLADVGAVSVALLPVALAGLLDRKGDGSPGTARRGLLASLAALALVFAVPAVAFDVVERWRDLVRPPAVAVVSRGSRSLPVSTLYEKTVLDGLFAVLREVSRPGARLVVGSIDLVRTPMTDTHLYYLLPDYVPGTYYLEMNPGSANRVGSRLAVDVERADVVLLNRHWESWLEATAAMAPGSRAPAEALARRFFLAGRSGPYEVYVRRAPPPGHPR